MAGIEPRRQDPASTSLGPAAAAVVTFSAVVFALPAAEVVARALSGGGVAWPGNPFATAWGVLSGRPGLGFTTAQPVPPRALVITVAVLLEVLVVVALALAGRRWSAVIAPGSAHNGFATSSQSRQVLGESMLHRRRREIRPDLYGRRTPTADGPLSALAGRLTRKGTR